MDHICGGSGKARLRKHLKNIAKETWQLVGWLTHARNANKTASSVAINSCHTVVGHFISVFAQEQHDMIDKYPACKSRNVRSHYDVSIPPDGDYYLSCGMCSWNNNPNYINNTE